MTEDFNYLFQYIEKEKLSIDKTEFLFQIQSHPDYPSLLSIVDALTFFNIPNGALELPSSEIDNLPDYFVALLKVENTQPQYYFLEKKENRYFFNKNNKTFEISRSEIESRWNKYVLLIENSEPQNFSKKSSKSKFYYFLPIIAFLLLLANFNESIATKLFFLFPAVGILFSIAALKDLFGTKAKIIDSFCNMTASTECSTVVESEKWKIFKIINFSDLSIVFFASQFIGILLFLLYNESNMFFSIQQILLFAALPVLFASIYYQKFVEKKWCPLCLTIIGITILENIFITVLKPTFAPISTNGIILFGFVFISVFFLWLNLKALLTNHKNLKEFKIEGSRFMRNYSIFKNTLLNSTQIAYTESISSPILLGDENGSLKIIVISNPFCGHCSKMHTIMEEILHKNREGIYFDLRFNFNENESDEKSTRIHHKLVSIYLNQGQIAFREAMKNWFENKDEHKIKTDNNLLLNNVETVQILKEQFAWNQANNLNFTPAIIINSFLFPKEFDRKQLSYFINDLIDDSNFFLNPSLVLNEF